MKAFLENTALLLHSLWYLTGIVVLILLATMFWQNVQAQNAAHLRGDASLQQSLQRNEQLLNESRQALLDHQRTMERLSQPR